MKKVLSALCALVVLTAMCGCSEGKKSEKESQSEATTTETTTAEEAIVTEPATTTNKKYISRLTETNNFRGLQYNTAYSWEIDETETSNCLYIFTGDLTSDGLKENIEINVYEPTTESLAFASIKDYYQSRIDGPKEFETDLKIINNTKGLSILQITGNSGRRGDFKDYEIYRDGYIYSIVFNAGFSDEDEVNDFIERLEIDSSEIEKLEKLKCDETYENDFYTMKIPSDCEQKQAGTAKSIKISDDIELVLWGDTTSLNYTDNENFSSYWANDCLELGYDVDVVCYGKNYYAKVNNISDGYIQFVCQNGDFIEFFEFYTKDEKSAEPIIENILSSVSLKKPKIDGLEKFPENTSP